MSWRTALRASPAWKIHFLCESYRKESIFLFVGVKIPGTKKSWNDSHSNIITKWMLTTGSRLRSKHDIEDVVLVAVGLFDGEVNLALAQDGIDKETIRTIGLGGRLLGFLEKSTCASVFMIFLPISPWVTLLTLYMTTPPSFWSALNRNSDSFQLSDRIFPSEGKFVKALGFCDCCFKSDGITWDQRRVCLSSSSLPALSL